MGNYIYNPIIRIWGPPVAGFLFYGAWAFLVNSPWLMNNGDVVSASKAALAQGSYSFVITLSLALFVEWMFKRLKDIPGRSLWVFLVAVLLMAVISSVLNISVGTPNVLWTVLPGLLVSAVYTAAYVLALIKTEGS
jgi:hypothetical protein